MWKLLKAQIEYNKIVLIICCPIFLSMYIAFIVQGWQEIDNSFPARRAVLLATTAMLFLLNMVRQQREKRDRFHHPLPLVLWQLGLSRLLQIALFWVSLLMLALFAFVMRSSIFDMKILWDLFSLTGFVMVVNAAPFIYRDLSYCFHSRSKKVILLIVYTFMILAGYLLFMLFIVSVGTYSISDSLLSIKNDFSDFISTFIGALIFNIIGIVLTGISLWIFSKRRTYTE